MTYLVSFSGGVASWAAAKRLRETVPPEAMVLLFADTLIEDEDAYRFLDEAAANIGVPLTRIADGRTPWQVFRDVRFIGNTRVDPCSRILKRELLARWRADRYTPETIVTVLGFHAGEESRIDRYRTAVAPWPVIAPLCDAPPIDKDDAMDWCEREGLRPPRLYALGFKNNNCGGFCIKAGREQFTHLLRMLPDRFRQHEEEEQATMRHLGRDDIAILRDRSGGTVKPISLRDFRHLVEEQREFDIYGGSDCACFAPET